MGKYARPLSLEQLNKLTTQRLLAYKNKLMKVHETGQGHNDYCPNFETCYGECGWSKAHPDWKQALKDVKQVLATREHVE